MIVVEDLLKPISEANPSGTNLKYDPVYLEIAEAQREEDDLGATGRLKDPKKADLPKVVKLTTNVLKNRSKDLNAAVWLTDALLRGDDGFAGLAAGLKLLHGLLDKFWDTLYPIIDEGDLEMRAAPLILVGSKMDVAVRNVPLNYNGHGLYDYDKSREFGYENPSAKDPEKKARKKALDEGALAPEAFDKSFNETPKAFYVTLEKDLAACLENLQALNTICDEKFRQSLGDDSPSFETLKKALEKVRYVGEALLAKKREKEPDPVVEKKPEPAQATPVSETPATETGAATAPAYEEPRYVPGPAVAVSFAPLASSESPGRKALVDAVAAAAGELRRREPYNPAPYLMMRGLRWGDLRVAAALSDPAMLEAPPTEARQQIKRLALAEKWKELLETAEALMAHPCSRAWLDLQRFVDEACQALGNDYAAIAVAIRSELRSLLRDVPQLLDATLMDDTPTANPQTREWLKGILGEPGGSPPRQPNIPLEDPPPQPWQKKYIDSMALAKEAVSKGQPDKAIDIMNQELIRQRSARGRFQRRLQFVEICLAAQKDAIVQPMLDDMIATIDTYKLEEWEDKSYMASAIITIMKASKKIQGDAKEKQKYFERVCRLDPAQALNC